MQKEIKKYLLQRVQNDWFDVRDQARLWGMWISYYQPISEDVEKINRTQFPLQAWFLSQDGLFERNIWELQRLQTVHFIQPWCGKMWGEPSNWWTKDKENIGFSSFAQYEDSLDFYLDSTWAGLFGKGWKLKFNQKGELIEWDYLWVS